MKLSAQTLLKIAIVVCLWAAAFWFLKTKERHAEPKWDSGFIHITNEPSWVWNDNGTNWFVGPLYYYAKTNE